MRIEDQFIPYELALKLKELGFNEPCMMCYRNAELYGSNVAHGYLDNWEFKTNYDYDIFMINKEHPNYWVSAPFWQQAFDWFEDNHKLYSSQDNVILDYGIADCRNNDIQIVKTISIDSTYKNREEVREARLEKLIELCQK